MHKFTKVPKPIIIRSSETILEDNNIYYFSSSFKSSKIREVIRFILERNLESKKDRPPHLTLIINSSGGSLPEAFALIDVMRGSAIPIKTIGIGEVCSCGLLTSMAGEPGLRYITANTSILSHQYYWGSEGKHHELESTTHEFTHAHNRMINHYIRCTGLDKETVISKLLPPGDVWLSPTMAIKYGLADKIIKL